jgi:tetratricopeptide (TPR) repeat protein
MARKRKPTAKKTDEEANFLESMLPDRRAMEKILRELTGGLGGEKAEETALDRAQEVMYHAFDASAAEQVRLARKALEISPDCADAHVLLAELAGTMEEARKHYEQGVAAGERALGKQAFAEYAGHFWGIMETRPYMRAREGLAQCLWEAGRREEATEHYRELLRLNPNDNQGVRYSLAALLLDMDRDQDLYRLVADYGEDASAAWAYTKTLLAFREDGDGPRANSLLKQAMNANKHVPAYLLGNKHLPRELPPYITIGGEDEAVGYAVGNRRGWLNTPGAISWLRNTLDVPLPKQPKQRRHSWPQLKLALLRLPQERGEVWEVDASQVPIGGGQAGEEAPWTVLIVARASHELLCLEVFDDRPQPGDVWDCLTDAMRQPQQTEPHRPAKIEVRQKTFQSAWKAKLKQVGVECVLCDALDTIAQIRNLLPPVNADVGAGEPDAAISPEEILALPIESAEVWQVDVRPMPTWITGEGQPYRPWLALVINRTDDFMLAHRMTPNRPPAASLWEAVLQAVRQPAIGGPHRPGTIEVSSVEQQDALLPFLDRAGIECVVLKRLEHLDAAMDSMAEHMLGQEGPPALLDVPGVELSQIGSFYAAAAEFYRRKPWRHVLGDTLIKVECDKFNSGPWYAVVMGQSGVQQGVAVYEDLAALQAMMTGGRSEEENARGMSALSLMFSEPFEIPVRDLDAAERHGWSVAGPEAYPMVIRVNPGCAVRPPLAWELELLEGCLLAIPDFLAEKNAVMVKDVAAASTKLTVRLSWVGEG